MKLIPMILKLPSPTGMKQQGSSKSDSQRQRESKNFGRKRVMAMIMKFTLRILILMIWFNKKRGCLKRAASFLFKICL